MTFMVFKVTECCALECELNKAEAVSGGRRRRWAGVMGYDATSSDLLVSGGGEAERKRFLSAVSPCEARGWMEPGQQLHHCPPASATVSWGHLGICSLLSSQEPVTGTSQQAAGLWWFGDSYITRWSFPVHYWLNVHHAKLECPRLGS